MGWERFLNMNRAELGQTQVDVLQVQKSLITLVKLLINLTTMLKRNGYQK